MHGTGEIDHWTMHAFCSDAFMYAHEREWTRRIGRIGVVM